MCMMSLLGMLLFHSFQCCCKSTVYLHHNSFAFVMKLDVFFTFYFSIYDICMCMLREMEKENLLLVVNVHVDLHLVVKF